MLLDDARAVLETGPVCDHCLGRCFHERGTNLANEDRGRALRVTVAMADDEVTAPVDPTDCWVCEGLVPDIDDWTDRVEAALADLSFETFLVGTRVPDRIEEHETRLRDEAGFDPEIGEPLNAECNREVGKRLETRMPAVVDHDYPDVVAIQDLLADEIELQFNPAYLYGRYRKHEPGLPQRVRVCRECNGRGTQWREGEAQPCDVCGGSGYATKESVEWYIGAAVRDTMEADDTVFNAAGNESADVLVKGEGRPFVIEVKEARKRPADAAAIEASVAEASDGAIEVHGLTPASRDLVGHLTQTAVMEIIRLEVTFGTKVVQASFDKALSTLDSTSIRQRVEYDGRVSEQVRSIDGLRGEMRSERSATIEVESTDGLDLRALIEGGTDRSEPNLADLLGTEISVESIAIVDVRGIDEPIENSTFLPGSRT